MDIFDRAQQADEFFRAQALREQLNRNRKIPSDDVQHHPGSGPLNPEGAPRSRVCIDCGYKIDPARIAAIPAAVRCVECQTKKERT